MAQFLCGNCAIPQNFHTRKLGEITKFYAVQVNEFSKTQIKNLKIFEGVVEWSLSIQRSIIIPRVSQNGFSKYSIFDILIFFIFSLLFYTPAFNPF